VHRVALVDLDLRARDALLAPQAGDPRAGAGQRAGQRRGLGGCGSTRRAGPCRRRTRWDRARARTPRRPRRWARRPRSAARSAAARCRSSRASPAAGGRCRA
jgi:hypothetical protein